MRLPSPSRQIHHAGRVPTPEPTLTPVALAISLDPLNALPVPVEAPPPVEWAPRWPRPLSV